MKQKKLHCQIDQSHQGFQLRWQPLEAWESLVALNYFSSQISNFLFNLYCIYNDRSMSWVRNTDICVLVNHCRSSRKLRRLWQRRKKDMNSCTVLMRLMSFSPFFPSMPPLPLSSLLSMSTAFLIIYIPVGYVEDLERRVKKTVKEGLNSSDDEGAEDQREKR